MAKKVPIRPAISATPAAAAPAARTGAANSAPERRPWLPPLTVVLTAIAVYANTLRNGFTLDDHSLILRNPRIADLGYIKYMLFDRELWRPLKRMTLMLDYAVWGVARPWGFHATNVLFHAAACLALYFFILRLARSRRLATITALLFAVHPVHVEAVANISHRKESMSLLFCLLGFLAYLRVRDALPRPGPVAALLARLGKPCGIGFVRAELVVLVGLSYLAGMLSKEVGAVMFPFVVVAYELIVAREPWTVRRAHLMRIAPVFLAVLALFWFRGYIGTLPRRFGTEQILRVSDSRFTGYGTMLLIAAKALTFDVGILLWSWPLYFDRVFTIPTGLGDPRVLCGLALAVTSLAAVVLLARRAPLISFAIAWFGIMLVPVANLVPLSYWFVAERFLYGPSVGFVLLVGLALEPVWRRTGSDGFAALRRSPATPALLALLCAWGAITVVQNRVWRTQEALWGYTLRFNGSSYRALYGYGLELAAMGRDAQAETFYRRAIAQLPAYQDVHVGLAETLLKLGRLDEAEDEARIARKLDPKDTSPWMVLGNAALAARRYPAAIDAYREALQLEPESDGALYNLANAQYGNGDNASAIQAFDRAMALRPPTLQQWLLRGRILRRIGRSDEALAAFARAEALEPGNPEVPDATGRLLLSLGRREEAARQLRRSLELKPGQPEILEILRRYNLN